MPMLHFLAVLCPVIDFITLIHLPFFCAFSPHYLWQETHEKKCFKSAQDHHNNGIIQVCLKHDIFFSFEVRLIFLSLPSQVMKTLFRSSEQALAPVRVTGQSAENRRDVRLSNHNHPQKSKCKGKQSFKTLYRHVICILVNFNPVSKL